jgi:hypothetical protein
MHHIIKLEPRLEGRSTIHGDTRECECPSVDTEQDNAGKEVHLRRAQIFVLHGVADSVLMLCLPRAGEGWSQR